MVRLVDKTKMFVYMDRSLIIIFLEREIRHTQLQHDGCNIVEIVGGKFHTFQLGHVGELHV